MAIDFPTSPSIGQTVTGPNGVVWQWDGNKWVAGSTAATTYAPVDSPAFTGNPTAPNPPVGDADTSVATTQFVAAATAPMARNVGRNLLHNPLFNVAQRGAGTFTTTGYTLDRWSLAFSLDTCTAQQFAATDAVRVGVGDEAANYIMTGAVTGNAGAGSYSFIYQPIEDVRRLAGKTITISFWAAANSGTPKLGVSLTQDFGTGGSPSAAVIINGQSVTVSSTWTRYSLTFTLPSIAGKALGTNGNSLTSMGLWFSAGATQNVRAGNIGVQTWNYNIWGVQLEIGTVATPLEKPDPQQDLAKCQRFYQTVACSVRAAMTGIGSLASPATWPQMRATPTVTLNAAGARSNTNSQSLTAGTPYGGFFGCASAAAGDAYVLDDLYNLSADL